MNETMTVVLALLAGVLLGLFFFGGLWWTIRRSLCSEQPALWFLGSLLLRTTAVLAGFYLVAQGDWRHLLACLSGFLLARAVVTRLTRVALEKSGRRIHRAVP